MYKDIMDKFYSFLALVEERGFNIKNISNLPRDLFPRPEYVHIKALLEDHFSPRKFTISEVQGLIKELYPSFALEDKKLLEKWDKLVPQWYKDKWFK